MSLLSSMLSVSFGLFFLVWYFLVVLIALLSMVLMLMLVSTVGMILNDDSVL